MNKFIVLKKNDDFNTIINEGKKITNSHFIVYFLPSSFFKSSIPKIGLSVGKKLGHAPFRNYQKRKLRMIVSEHQSLLSSYHYVIILRHRGSLQDYDVLSKSLSRIFKEIHEK